MSYIDNKNSGKEWFNEDVDFELEKFDDYDDSLVESPIVKFSDEDLFEPAEINLRKMAADAAEKERLEKEAEEKAKRKEELAGKYSDVIYKIESVTDSHPEGIELGRLEAAFGELVPAQGEADTIAGELVRAAMRICYRYYNDGDYFFMGYGLETAGPSAAYLIDMGYDDIIYGATKIAEDYYPGFDDDKIDDAYEKFLKELAMKITDNIIEDVELLEDPNDKDSRSYDDDKTSDTYAMLVEEQPRFDYDFMVSDRVRELVDADIIRDRDIVDYVENYIDYNSAFEGSEVYMSSDYVVVEHLTIEGYEELQDMIKRHGDKFWEDLENEYEDEYNELYAEDEEEDDEYEDDAEDFEESLNNKFNCIKTNTKNDVPVDESLYNKIIANDLEYNPEIDSLTAEEDGITIDIQDRESHEHSKRGPRRWASPKVKTNSWGRIWKDGECKQYNGSKYEVRSQMAKDLKDIDEDFNYSSNSYKLETADDILSTLIDNVPEDQIDTIVATTERIGRKLKAKKMSELYVLTVDDEYSPDWSMATKGENVRVRGNSIQYWTLGGNLFASIRVNGQEMLFFNSEEIAKDYIGSVDDENMVESVNSDSAVSFYSLKNGDEFEFAEDVFYDDIDNFAAVMFDADEVEDAEYLILKYNIPVDDDGNIVFKAGVRGKVVGSQGPMGVPVEIDGYEYDFGGIDFKVKKIITETLLEKNIKDKAVEVDPWTSFEIGDKFEFAENVPYADVESAVYDSIYDGLSPREINKKLRAQGFIIDKLDGEYDWLIIPSGMIGECVGGNGTEGAIIKVGELELGFAGEEFSVVFLNDKQQAYDEEEVRRYVEEYLDNYPYPAGSDVEDICEEICENVFEEDYHDCHYSLGETVYHTVEEYLNDLNESCNKKSVKEGYHENSEEYSPFFPEDYQLIDEQTANFFIQTTKVLHDGNQIGYIQKHPKRGGNRKTDSNRVRDTYYVAIRDGAGQSMVDTPEEAVKFILGKSEAIKESAFDTDALRRFQDKQRNK